MKSREDEDSGTLNSSSTRCKEIFVGPNESVLSLQEKFVQLQKDLDKSQKRKFSRGNTSFASVNENVPFNTNENLHNDSGRRLSYKPAKSGSIVADKGVKLLKPTVLPQLLPIPLPISTQLHQLPTDVCSSSEVPQKYNVKQFYDEVASSLMNIKAFSESNGASVATKQDAARVVYFSPPPQEVNGFAVPTQMSFASQAPQKQVSTSNRTELRPVRPESLSVHRRPFDINGSHFVANQNAQFSRSKLPKAANINYGWNDSQGEILKLSPDYGGVIPSSRTLPRLLSKPQTVPSHQWTEPQPENTSEMNSQVAVTKSNEKEGSATTVNSLPVRIYRSETNHQVGPFSFPDPPTPTFKLLAERSVGDNNLVFHNYHAVPSMGESNDNRPKRKRKAQCKSDADATKQSKDNIDDVFLEKEDKLQKTDDVNNLSSVFPAKKVLKRIVSCEDKTVQVSETLLHKIAGESTKVDKIYEVVESEKESSEHFDEIVQCGVPPKGGNTPCHSSTTVKVTSGTNSEESEQGTSTVAMNPVKPAFSLGLEARKRQLAHTQRYLTSKSSVTSPSFQQKDDENDSAIITSNADNNLLSKGNVFNYPCEEDMVRKNLTNDSHMQPLPTSANNNEKPKNAPSSGELFSAESIQISNPVSLNINFDPTSVPHHSPVYGNRKDSMTAIDSDHISQINTECNTISTENNKSSPFPNNNIGTSMSWFGSKISFFESTEDRNQPAHNQSFSENDEAQPGISESPQHSSIPVQSKKYSYLVHSKAPSETPGCGKKNQGFCLSDFASKSSGNIRFNKTDRQLPRLIFMNNKDTNNEASVVTPNRERMVGDLVHENTVESPFASSKRREGLLNTRRDSPHSDSSGHERSFYESIQDKGDKTLLISRERLSRYENDDSNFRPLYDTDRTPPNPSYRSSSLQSNPNKISQLRLFSNDIGRSPPRLICNRNSLQGDTIHHTVKKQDMDSNLTSSSNSPPTLRSNYERQPDVACYSYREQPYYSRYNEVCYDRNNNSQSKLVRNGDSSSTDVFNDSIGSSFLHVDDAKQRLHKSPPHLIRVDGRAQDNFVSSKEKHSEDLQYRHDMQPSDLSRENESKSYSYLQEHSTRIRIDQQKCSSLMSPPPERPQEILKTLKGSYIESLREELRINILVASKLLKEKQLRKKSFITWYEGGTVWPKTDAARLRELAEKKTNKRDTRVEKRLDSNRKKNFDRSNQKNHSLKAGYQYSSLPSENDSKAKRLFDIKNATCNDEASGRVQFFMTSSSCPDGHSCGTEADGQSSECHDSSHACQKTARKRRLPDTERERDAGYSNDPAKCIQRETGNPRKMIDSSYMKLIKGGRALSASNDGVFHGEPGPGYVKKTLVIATYAYPRDSVSLAEKDTHGDGHEAVVFRHYNDLFFVEENPRSTSVPNSVVGRRKKASKEKIQSKPKERKKPDIEQEKARAVIATNANPHSTSLKEKRSVSKADSPKDITLKEKRSVSKADSPKDITLKEKRSVSKADSPKDIDEDPNYAASSVSSVGEADSRTGNMEGETESTVSGSESDDEDNSVDAKIPRKSVNASKPKRYPRLYKFLLQLLEHNNPCVEWINKDERLFRFLDSNRIARLWGATKNKPRMKYEHFARSLRCYKERGILRKPRRKLVYQFADGW